ncbi:hypothetical protein M413DRAFT_443376 [Hebeloma cylindrosporum]|uniref:Uncharacterized protein n=1 Tax=Hebeloma cylindrosporum TaxID=76867 RepID=A0A0C2YQX4_HEBCY|nr:hypothetical protein M413DRAFT_443376 [Hebeloma cylindrosporum h7]
MKQLLDTIRLGVYLSLDIPLDDSLSPTLFFCTLLGATSGPSDNVTMYDVLWYTDLRHIKWWSYVAWPRYQDIEQADVEN